MESQAQENHSHSQGVGAQRLFSFQLPVELCCELPCRGARETPQNGHGPHVGRGMLLCEVLQWCIMTTLHLENECGGAEAGRREGKQEEQHVQRPRTRGIGKPTGASGWEEWAVKEGGEEVGSDFLSHWALF